MTRSSSKELYTPYKDLERGFRSSRRHFKSLSFNRLRSPDFNLLSDQENSEEEKEEAMGETMEQYMSKTRADYGSGVARPKIDDKSQFELKGQFLKELHVNTFSGSDNEDANEHIEKVLKIVDLFHAPNITILDSRGVVPTKTAADAKKAIQKMAEYSQKWHNGTSKGRSIETSDGLADIQAQLNNLGRENKKVNEKVYAAQVGCEQCKGPHYTKDCLKKEEGKTLKEAYYTQFGGPFQGGGYKATARGQDKRRFIFLVVWRIITVKKRGTMDQNSHMLMKLHLSITPYPRKEKDLGSFTLPCFINDFCFDNALVDLGASVSVMPLSTYLNLGLGELTHTRLTMELADRTVKYLKGIAENVLVRIGKFTFPIDFIILDMPKDIKVPLILRRPFLSTARAKIDVYKRKITLRVGEENIIFKSVKPASSIIKRVYMLSLRERMELDLEARLIGETLVLNRSLDPFLEDYIELYDLNEPFELRRNQ
ncbi:DNA-directed DNA polymerase [Tanacetum coccineum]